MGGRYVITGVELGILISADVGARQNLVDEIIENGYICDNTEKQELINIIRMSLEKTYTAKEIEKLLELSCCHISGTHDPTHFENNKYICDMQIADAYQNLCLKLLINPVVKHSENCSWCRTYPDKMKGDGREYWDKPHLCARCGSPEYVHKYNNHQSCNDFTPTSFEVILELYGKKGDE